MVNMEYSKLMEKSIERIGFKFKDTFVAGGNVNPDDIDKKTELLKLSLLIISMELLCVKVR